MRKRFAPKRSLTAEWLNAAAWYRKKGLPRDAAQDDLARLVALRIKSEGNIDDAVDAILSCWYDSELADKFLELMIVGRKAESSMHVYLLADQYTLYEKIIGTIPAVSGADGIFKEADLRRALVKEFETKFPVMGRLSSALHTLKNLGVVSDAGDDGRMRFSLYEYHFSNKE